MSFETLQYKRQGMIGVITLNRPERLNALSAQLIADLNNALDRAEADEEVRVVVLNGAGRAFCAGFDLKEEAEAETKGVADWQPVLQRDFDVIMRFWRCPKPTIAAIHGFAVAGGCELAVACDITIAADNTMMGEPELRFGAGIVVLLLPWLTGPKQAKEMLLTGNDRVPAQRALEMGLINKVVADGEHLEAAMTTAREIAVMDSASIALTKKAINQTYDIMGMRQALDAALDIDVLIEALVTPERETFQRISREQGLKAAIAWRDQRFRDA